MDSKNTAYADWRDIGISLAPGRRERFVATDGISGWFEGFTHTQELGQGYMVRHRFVLRSWASSVNGRPLDRAAKALSDTVFPWGHECRYHEASEALVLHQGRRVLSLRVASALDARLEIRLGWDGHCAERVWRELDGALVAAPPAAADSVTIEGVRPGSALEPGLWIGRWDEPGPRVLTVHLAFGESEEELRENLALVRRGGAFEAEIERRWQALNETWIRTGDEDYDRALFWAAASARSLVSHEYGTGIWAGLPWFKDNWGRDTFIALPGTLLCTGQFATAKAVLRDFAQRQNLDQADIDYGRIPNRVNPVETIYNTVDGTPWLIRELDDYCRHSGDREFARSLRPLIKHYVAGALKHFVDEQGFLSHDDADTWMDARIEGDTPWSPRGDRAVEIQALWYSALLVGAALAREDGDAEEAGRYEGLAQRLKANFARAFVHQGRLVDHLDADGRPELSLRPNALMVATVPLEDLVDPAVLKRTVELAAEALLHPHGILSLAADDPDFHPWHEYPARWHKDAAYHNGTIWGWNAGFTVSALVRFGHADKAWRLSRNLAWQILELGAVGTMSELLDAMPGPDGQPVPSGTFSQAWSVSEFVRNAWEDYLGCRPDALQGRVVFKPQLPADWTHLRARVRVGPQTVLMVEVLQAAGETDTMVQDWTIRTEGPGLRVAVLDPAAGESPLAESLPGELLVFRRELAAPRRDSLAWAQAIVPGSAPAMAGSDVLLRKRRAAAN